MFLNSFLGQDGILKMISHALRIGIWLVVEQNCASNVKLSMIQPTFSIIYGTCLDSF